ncbi:hypothetical protein AYL99_04009 [Fonsecaea erecta]|uniref:Alcohol dehydrogenase 1 n=1 Tax=Fonsecaea erecta TaxID=1367422 RepID=A0A178ZR07_9EURO|nr:hypothetical protein AYL99_04009 [Fonsecaea erecta]OAP61806.1 hypothetical protein AYL99_04009 [Fonsecaea erecta]
MSTLAAARAADGTPVSLPDGRRVRGQFFGQSSFSELAIVDVRSVVKFAGAENDLSFLARLGCGYMTGAGTIFNVLRPPATSALVVLGLGAVGLAALELARSLGVRHVINSQQGDIAKSTCTRYPDGVGYIVDTTGSTSLITSGIKAPGHSGTLAVVGVSAPGTRTEIDPVDLLISCKRAIGVILGSADLQQLLPRLVKLVRPDEFPVRRLSKVYAAQDIDQAVADMEEGLTVKPVLAW